MRLTKHHGLGNDFLVHIDLDGIHPVAPAQAAALCDRHRGVGADGLIRVTTGTDGAQVAMELWNSDGSRAEMSGNGIRCLAQAVFQSGLAEPPELRVMTDAGLRTVRVLERSGRHTHRLSVDMGAPKLEGDEPEWVDGDVLRATRIDFGNPHLVLQWGGSHLPDPTELGARIDAATPGGANVELIRPATTPGDLDMVVHERGAGPTLACGTGACAAVVAARAWELAGDPVTVTMPGGAVQVTGADPVMLIGEATSVAVIDTPWP